MALFTPEELAALAAVDASIEDTFRLTKEEIARSNRLDRYAKLEALPVEARERKERQKVCYLSRRAARQAYYQKNRAAKLQYQREYDKKRQKQAAKPKTTTERRNEHA